MSDAGCVFCEIVAGRSPASFVHQDDEVVAFVDIRPVNSGQLVVAPRRHAELLTELPSTTWARVAEVAQMLAAAARRVPDVRCEAVNLIVADGIAAGQEVLHAHMLVIPRFDGDGFGFRVPPGFGQFLARPDMDAIAAKIRSAIA